jgi:preprotein translocase subunit SecG
MADVIFTTVWLAILFILASVLLDYSLSRMGHERGSAVRTDWPIRKQQLVRDLLFAKGIASFFAAVFSVLSVIFVVTHVLFSLST